jgi:SulP family sulfate permease
MVAAVARNASAGTVAGLVTLAYSTSYGVLIFSGEGLERHAALGVQAALTAACIVALVVARGSSFPFAIAGPEANATAIVAVMASGLAGTLVRQHASSGEIVSSVLAMLAASAVVTGSLVAVLGVLRGGRFVQLLPYPVAAGFLAGTGYLLVDGGVKVLTGTSIGWAAAAAIAGVSPLALVVTVCCVLAFLVVPRLVKHVAVTPVIIAGGVLVFYVGGRLLGFTVDDMRAKGMLFTPLGAVSVVPALADVRWDAVLGQWQPCLAMVGVVMVTIVLQAAALDVSTRYDADFDRELRVHGLANIASGLAGGMVGSLSISRSLLNFRTGARSRWAGGVSAAVCVTATLGFPDAFSSIPRPVLAGLLLSVGLPLLREWAWDTFAKLPLAEYGLILVILALIVGAGLIVGVVFGVFMTCAFFVYSYSRTQCIAQTVSPREHFSNKERSLEETTLLRRVGGAGRALCLQGYIFFGTSGTIVETCRSLIAGAGVRYLLLDFRLVQGLDASAASSFMKLARICEQSDTRLLLSGLHADLRVMLAKTGLLDGAAVPVFVDLDRGLEWVEDRVLSDAGAGAPDVGDEFRRTVTAHFTRDAQAVLDTYVERVTLPEGVVLFRRGDPGDALYIIETGEASVLLRISDTQTKRLVTLGPGMLIGEMALYTGAPRSADVVTDMPCRMHRLTVESFSRLQRQHPEEASQFHRFVVARLAARLAAATEEMRVLL